MSLAAAAAGLRDAGARDKANAGKGSGAANALSLAEVQGGLLRLRKTGRITPHGGVRCPPQSRKSASPQNLIQTALLRKFHVCCDVLSCTFSLLCTFVFSLKSLCLQNVQPSPDDSESSQDFGFGAPTPLSAAAAPSTTTTTPAEGEGEPAAGETDGIDTESGIVDEEADQKCVASAN